MVRSMQLAPWIIVLVLLGELAFVNVQAQTDHPGTLYFDAVSQAVTFSVDQTTAVSAAYCQGTQVEAYGAGPAAPAAADSQNAYASGNAVYGACSTNFLHTLDAPTVLDGKATVHFWAACDVAAATGFPLRARLAKVAADGTVTTLATADDNDDAPPQCETTPMEFSIDVPIGDAEEDARTFAAGDVVRASIFQWYAGSPAPALYKNFHYLVGSSTHPSGVTAEGLPLPVPTLRAVVRIEAPVDAAAVAAGGTANYSLVVANDGDAEGNLSLAAAGLPEGFEARFEPPQGTVQPGKTTAIALMVDVPGSAEVGSYPFTAMASMGASAQTQNLSLTVEAAPADGTPSTSPPTTTTGPPRNWGTPGPDDAADNQTSESTDDAGPATTQDSGDAGGIPGPFAGPVIAALAFGVLIARRRAR